MTETMKKPVTLQQAIIYFADQDRAFQYAVELRWPDGRVTCPRCGSQEHSFVSTRKIWFCKGCKKQFTVKVGTIFEDSALGMDKWMTAVWMIVNCKNGISSHELARSLGVTQKSAWFMLHRVREALREGSIMKLGGTGGPVEIDETFVGAIPDRMHRSRRMKLQTAITQRTHKTPVMGMLDRDTRQVRAKVVPNAKRETLQNEILNHLHDGATLYTDQYTGYERLPEAQKFIHETVNHMETYVRGQVHTQGIENFWSLLKRQLRGTYVAVEPFHLDRYVSEQVFRYNNRATKDNQLDDLDRFMLAMSQISGKRLTYSDLTGKGQGAA